MQPYDIAMLVILGGATLLGFWKGLAWQVASIGSLVASYFVALKLSPVVAPWISAREPWNRFAAMLILYLTCSLAIWFLFRRVSEAIEKVKLKDFDRQIGALVGFAKGALICVALTFFAVTLSESARQKVLSSHSGHYIALVIDKAGPLMPGEVHDVLGPYLRRLDDELAPALGGRDTSHDEADAEGDFAAEATPEAVDPSQLSDDLRQAIRQAIRP